MAVDGIQVMKHSLSVVLFAGGLIGAGIASFALSVSLGGPHREVPRVAAPDAGADVLLEIGRVLPGRPDELFVRGTLSDRQPQWSSTDSFRPPVGSGRPAPGELTPEFIERCLEVAHMIQPALGDALRALRERDPAMFEERLRRSTRLISLTELRERDPSFFELKLLELRVDAEVLRLARDLRHLHVHGGSSERIEELERQLLGQVRLQITFSLKARIDYLCQLQEEVARLERELARDREQADQLVDDRLRSLLGEAYHEQIGSPRR